MERFIVYKTHYNDGKGWIRNIGTISPAKVVEDFQARLRDLGHPDGVTWQTHEGDLISAMVASTKI